MNQNVIRKNMPIKNNHYHSTLKNEYPFSENIPYIEEYHDQGSIVFKHNIIEKITDLSKVKAFSKADAIYSEPAWNHGFSLYYQRANQKPESYQKYLESINRLIINMDVPSYIVMGKRMLQSFEPDTKLKVQLNSTNAWLCVWNAPEPVISKSIIRHIDIIEYIANKYNHILDFCCGYGNIIPPLLDKGKTFTCSDINIKCVYYIASNYMGLKIDDR
jgi:hypothetical protein